MHGYDDHKALYLNCEIHSPWVRGSGPMVGPLWPYSENVLENLLLYYHSSGRKTKYMVMMSMKPSTKIMKLMTLGSGVQVLGRG